jgi:hypothetical protein
VGAPEPIEVDISNLSAEDLESLKQEDPFLYYSIPAVRRTTFNFEEPDLTGSSLEESTTTTVKRCTRVSFECPSDLLMEDLLGDLEEGYDHLIWSIFSISFPGCLVWIDSITTRNITRIEHYFVKRLEHTKR